MNKFFVLNEIYKDRITICKSCVSYFRPTGIVARFVKVSGRVKSMN